MHIKFTPTANPAQYVARAASGSPPEQLILVRLRVGELLPECAEWSGPAKGLWPEILGAVTELGCAVAPAGVFLRGAWIDSMKRSVSLYVSVHVEYTAPEPLNAKTLARQLGHGQAAYAGYQTFVRVDLHEVHRDGAHYTTLPEQEYAAVKRDIHWV